MLPGCVAGIFGIVGGAIFTPGEDADGEGEERLAVGRDEPELGIGLGVGLADRKGRLGRSIVEAKRHESEKKYKRGADKGHDV